MIPPAQRSPLLGPIPHGFFGRPGGVSQGIYASLNTGPGSNDDPAAVTENRQLVQTTLGANALVSVHQIHSPTAIFVEAPFSPAPAPQADAMVTDRPGLAIGVMAADCTPVLFSSGTLVAAAHAGWRGSLDGILEATVALMVEHGAAVDTIHCAIGPCLRAPAFEVEQDLIDAVCAKYPTADRFFTPGAKPDKFIYDHVAFVRWRLETSGILIDHIDDVGGCPLSQPDLYFSYRHSRQIGAPDYGRNLSVIMRPMA